jgi:hypothetical protein
MGSYSVNDIYVSSFEGSRISTAAYDTTTKAWSLNMPDDFDGMKLRFWVDFKESGSSYCFYEDIVWRKDSPTNIAITYRGTPIKNYADLQRIAGSGHFVVTNAISVGAAPWVPIDTFQGTLHGGGYKITGIKFAQSPSAGSYGLFRKLTGNVSDLKLEYADTAPLVLSAWAPTVGGNFAMAGILAGEAAANSNIKNVMVSLAAGVSAFSVKSTVSGTNDVYVGGIVGYLNEGLLEQSYSGAGIELAAGSTTGPRYFMGGLAGMSKRQITASYARGRVSANNASLINGAVYAGGLTGGLNGTGSSTTIEKSYASGDILAVINNAGVTVNIGGLAGRIDGNYRINNSVAANETVTASDTGTVSVGSLIGSSQDIFGDNNKQKDPMHISGGTKYERQASASSLTTASDYQPMFSGSDNPWVWDNASGYPKLFWQQSSVDIFEKLDLSAFLGSFLGH